MNRKYWDLGEENIIAPSKKNLANILNALILCKGKLHNIHSSEIRDSQWVYNTRSCAVVFRISLLIDMRDKFEELSGYKLSNPPQIQLK